MQTTYRSRRRYALLAVVVILAGGYDFFPQLAVRGASIFGLPGVTMQGTVTAASDTIPPSSVSNLASADTFNPALMPPCGPVSLYPMINSMGVTIATPVTGTDHATIRYRVSGAADWIEGHDAVLTNTGRVDGSLFWLSGSTTYDVEVTSRTSSGSSLTVNTCTATTQAESVASATTRTLYVSAAAAPGGNGSQAQPYTTIQSAVAVAVAGDTIQVGPGVYYESLTPPRSGQPNAMIKIIGESGAIIDGSDQNILASGLSWSPDGTYPNVYSATLPANISFSSFLAQDPIWRDTLHFYQYDDLAGLRSGTGHASVPMAEGWFYDPATRLLTVRSTTAPSSHAWHIRANSAAFYLTSRNYWWIEGLTIRYFPVGIYIPSGQHNVLHGNDIQAETGVLIDNSQGPVAEGNRLENNHVFDAPLADWGYLAVKSTPMEAGGLVAWRGTGNIFRDNRIEQTFNGIFTGDSTETDVYRNVIRHLGDDGIETDGNAENVRVWGNAVDDINSALSLAPTTVGPVWAIYNRFTQFTGRAFKIGGGVSGYDFFYHNTVYSTTADGFGTQQVTTDTNRLVFRNNIIQTTNLAIRWTEAMTGLDMDHDNVYSTYAPPYVWQHLTNPYPYNYYHVSEICSGEGQECHGSEALPKLVNPNSGSFGLQATSPNIDAAVLIPGINHNFAGAGPDRGYLEYGQPEIRW